MLPHMPGICIKRLCRLGLLFTNPCHTRTVDYLDSERGSVSNATLLLDQGVQTPRALHRIVTLRRATHLKVVA